MSRAVRCLECFRHGAVPDTATERQRRNTLATFDELDPNLVLHVAMVGHNEWEYMSVSTAEWEYLGPYLGDGYFQADTEGAEPGPGGPDGTEKGEYGGE